MRAIVLCVVAVLVGGVASAQSLAEVARQEQERRKRITTPSRLYTDKDVKPHRPAAPPPAQGGAVQPPGAVQSSAPAQDAPASPLADGAQPPPAPDTPQPSDEEARATKEQEWRQRMAAARSDLERSRMFAEALQSRINALTNDFYARDDPAQRSVIETDRQKALAEIERVKKEVQEKTKALADLEEEARRAGVPPGWLR